MNEDESGSLRNTVLQVNRQLFLCLPRRNQRVGSDEIPRMRRAMEFTQGPGDPGPIVSQLCSHLPFPPGVDLQPPPNLATLGVLSTSDPRSYTGICGCLYRNALLGMERCLCDSLSARPPCAIFSPSKVPFVCLAGY